MALLQILLAYLTQSIGRILNAAFGWATVLLFGKVPRRRQVVLSGIAFGSALWMTALLGILIPRVALFLIAFVPTTSDSKAEAIRRIMAVAAVALPIVVGELAVHLHPATRPPRGLERLRAWLFGYPYTFGISLTFALLLVLAPALRVRDLIQRWRTDHIPLVVEEEHYDEVLESAQKVLGAGGLLTRRDPVSWTLRVPTHLLGLFARGAFGPLLAERLTVLRGARLEVTVLPFDLVIRGHAREVTRARALLTAGLAFCPAYLTWSAEANELERRLLGIWRDLDAAGDDDPAPSVLARLRDFEGLLQKVAIPFEEWEVLFREQLLIERALLERALGASADEDPAHARTPGLAASTVRRAANARPAARG